MSLSPEFHIHSCMGVPSSDILQWFKKVAHPFSNMQWEKSIKFSIVYYANCSLNKHWLWMEQTNHPKAYNPHLKILSTGKTTKCIIMGDELLVCEDEWCTTFRSLSKGHYYNNYLILRLSKCSRCVAPLSFLKLSIVKCLTMQKLVLTRQLNSLNPETLTLFPLSLLLHDLLGIFQHLLFLFQ